MQNLWSFDRLAEAAFALDPGVRWVAVGWPKQPPRWMYRPGIQPLNPDTSDEAEERLVNPAILTLAGARGDWDLGGLQFVILGYNSLTQVVAPLQGGGHISLSANLGVDAFRLGKALADLAGRADETFHMET